MGQRRWTLRGQWYGTVTEQADNPVAVAPPGPSRPFRVIGLVGGVGSGKSEAARRLAELGAWIVDVDHLGHEVLENPEVKTALVERWGRAVLTCEGKVDRRAVAERVFSRSPGAATERKFLESLVHPQITQRLADMLRNLAETPSVHTVVLDAALLFEAGWDRFCDVVIFVDAPDRERLRRATQRGWSRDHWLSREEAQLALDEKRRRANVVLTNAGTLSDFRQQVDAWWRTWSGRPNEAT